MKTLYISDMDGTLLNDGGKVSRRSVEIINELIKKGMLFTVLPQEAQCLPQSF